MLCCWHSVELVLFSAHGLGLGADIVCLKMRNIDDALIQTLWPGGVCLAIK
jgi:hypothetical protein